MKSDIRDTECLPGTRVRVSNGGFRILRIRRTRWYLNFVPFLLCFALLCLLFYVCVFFRFFRFFFWQICSTGRFKGDVSFGSIVVENGGKLEGKVNYGGCRSPLPETEDGAGSGANGSGEDSSSSTTTTTTTKTKTTSGTTAAKAPTPVGTATPVTTPTATATPITTTTPTSPGTVMPSVAATAAAFKKPVLAAASVGPGSGIGRVKLLRVTGASPRSSLRPVPIQSPE